MDELVYRWRVAAFRVPPIPLTLRETGQFTPLFFKQHGDWLDETHPAADTSCQHLSDKFVTLQKDEHGRPIDYKGVYMCRAGKKASGALLDGVEHKEWPHPIPKLGQESNST